MSTGYLFNGFGSYETKGKEKGITLTYGGVEFWLPYKKVTPIPDFNFRELDHEATAEEWENGNSKAMIYKVNRVPGARICEELTQTQQPIKNSEKGIISLLVHRDKLSEKWLRIPAGYDENGTPQVEEVRELKPSLDEVTLAETIALEYKRLKIEEYFDSKRARLAGEQGHLRPQGLVKKFMEELGIEDIDQVTLQTRKPQSMSPEVMQEFLAMVAAAVNKGIDLKKATEIAKEAAPQAAAAKATKEQLEKETEEVPEEAFE